ncbi:MAG: DUF4215 domain-containing protein, partial [Patescibacteria group bacterium]
TNPERIENKKINLDAQIFTFTGQQKNCIGLIANDPGSQQDNEFETCFCVECGDNKKWENNKCIPCGTDETWDATTKKCVTKTEPAVASTCGDGKVEGTEQCDCGDPAKGDIWCFRENLNSNSEYCTSPPLQNTPIYPNAKLSCYPPGSSKECKYNTQGCDNNKIPCFIDAQCSQSKGEKCHPTEYYCYVPPSTCGDGTKDAEEVCDKILTPTKVCTEIDITKYSSGRATCKQDCSGWDVTNCQTKTPEGKKVQITNVFCDNCIDDNFIYPNSPFTASCEVLFTPAQTSFGDIDFIEASFDNQKCTKIANEGSTFYFGCSSGAAQESRKKLNCAINDQKAASKGYIRDGEDKNLNIKVTTEGNICQLTSAKIELQGTDNKADSGDKIKISAAVTGDCSSAKYFQLDAISSDNSCKIEYTGGTLSGFTKQNPTFPLTFEWTVPSDLKTCIGKTVRTTGAALWPDVPGKTSTTQISTLTPTGSFTFASATGTTGCGNGVIDSEETCDDGNIVNGDGCSSTCQDEIPGPICDNGNLEVGELCDKTLLNGIVCTDLGYTGGTLACDSNCQFVTSQCTSVTIGCGNGVIDSEETCDDGNIVNGDGCSSTCQDEIPGPICDNGNLEVGELCDKTLLNGIVCTDLGYTGGTLACDSNCQFVTSQCTSVTIGCGNGVVETDLGETCDCGNNNPICSYPELQGQTCETRGIDTKGQGRLSCYLPSHAGLGCKFNEEACKDINRKCEVDKSCKTSDVCDGKIACENGVLMGDCIKIDPACGVVHQCIGSATNADLCSSDNLGLTADTTITFVSSCTDAKKCEFTCKSGFKLEN